MRVFGLIGYPLSHSFSEKYFKEKFIKENIKNVVYKNFPIKDIREINDLIQSNENISGLNVTAPYKEVVIPLLDEINISAKEAKAVNVIKIIRNSDNIKLIGYNTDVYGFQNSLQKKIDSDVKSALILGTGGAAKAVSIALKNMNIAFRFVSRKNTKLHNAIMYRDLTRGIVAGNLLIVNATPLGIYPETDKKPGIPYEFITSQHHLFDLIYNPSETLFLKEGIQKKATVQNGLEMLHLQAEKAWEIFNNS
jgi:shikimate dehydrogenase